MSKILEDNQSSNQKLRDFSQYIARRAYIDRQQQFKVVRYQKYLADKHREVELRQSRGS